MIDLRIRHHLPAPRGSASPGFDLDVTFATEDRTLVIFGPSGSGKTLTLKAIAGLLHPDEGRIVMGGATLLDTATGINLPARNRGMGYVFQDYALFPHLSVRENVAFGRNAAPRHHRQQPADSPPRHGVDELLAMFEIDHVADNLPDAISGGQRQRTALARALAASPRALLLDEPLAALDPLLRTRMRQEFTRMFERFGIPVVIITHDPEDVDAFADTLVLYEGGTIRHRLDFRAHRAAHGMARCPGNGAGHNSGANSCQDQTGRFATELLTGLMTQDSR